jgi:hypothetical protein
MFFVTITKLNTTTHEKNAYVTTHDTLFGVIVYLSDLYDEVYGNIPEYIPESVMEYIELFKESQGTSVTHFEASIVSVIQGTALYLVG